MAARIELADHVGGNTRFDVEYAGEEPMIIERADVVLSVKARGFDSFLRIHAELDYVEQYLQQALILIVATRRAEHHERLAVFEHQGRGQCDARTFARRDDVRTARISQRRLQTLAHQGASVSGNYCRQ